MPRTRKNSKLAKPQKMQEFQRVEIFWKKFPVLLLLMFFGSYTFYIQIIVLTALLFFIFENVPYC